MAIATLSIDLEMRLAKLEQGLNRAAQQTERAATQIESRFSKIGSALTGLGAGLAGALSVGAVAAFAQRTIDSIDALNDLSDASGASIENLSALEDIAARTGTSFDAVGTSIVKFNQVLNQAKPDNPAGQALKALGLSVTELRQLDPAEALRQVAVGLARFADEGDKARVVQELFGKSVREVAPFLKDLAEAGQLNATVTTEQAKQAERFNQELSKLRKNTEDGARAILSQLVPAVNTLAERLRGLSGAGGIGAFFGSLGQEFDANLATDELNRTVVRIESLQKQLEGETDANLRSGTEKKIAALRDRARELQGQLLRTTDALKGFAQAAAPVEFAPDGSDNRFFRTRPSIGELPDPAKDKKGARPKTPGRADIFDLGSFEDIQAVDVANARERIAERTRELADAEKARNDQLARLDELTGRTAARRFAQDLDALNQEFLAGERTFEEYTRGVENLEKALGKLPDVTKPAIEELSEFAKQAQRNIQDALGDTLLSTLTGRFDDIGRAWTDLLLRLTAQAAATRLGEALFGKDGSSGLLTDVFKTIFPSSGTRALGGPVAAGGTYLVGENGPEVFRPAVAGSIVPNSALGGVTIHQTINVGGGASRSEVVAAMQQARASAVAEVQELMRRGRMA